MTGEGAHRADINVVGSVGGVARGVSGQPALARRPELIDCDGARGGNQN